VKKKNKLNSFVAKKNQDAWFCAQTGGGLADPFRDHSEGGEKGGRLFGENTGEL